MARIPALLPDVAALAFAPDKKTLAADFLAFAASDAAASLWRSAHIEAP